MCFVSVKEDLDCSEPGRLRRVSRSRTNPTRAGGVRRPAQGRILEERYPSETIPPVRSTSTRGPLPPTRIYTNQYRKPTASRLVSRTYYHPEGIERDRSCANTGPNDRSAQRSANQSATGIETKESQSKRTSPSVQDRNGNLSQYIEVEFYSTSSSSLSSEPRQNARVQTTGKTRTIPGHPKPTTAAQASKSKLHRSRDSEGEITEGRASRGSYRTDRRKAATDYTYGRSHRGPI